MTFSSSNYAQILDNISKYGTKNVKMVAVSKNHSVETIKMAINSGIRIFGENKVQEAEKKFINLKDKFQNLELHLTGPLQTNKVKNAIRIFDIFQTLDREKLAKEFSKYSESMICCICYVKLKPKEIEGFFTGYYL